MRTQPLNAGWSLMSGKGDAGIALQLPPVVVNVCHVIAGPWLAFTLVVYLFAFAGGFVQTWGRDYSFTLTHFKTAFEVQWGEFGWVWAGTAWNSLFNTVSLSAMAAPVCAALGLLMAWLLARTEFKGKNLFEFASLITFAIPGTVLGVSYILAFNVPPVELTGTGLVIVLCFIFRNLPVGVSAGSAAFKQLDRSLDEASVMLRASTLTGLREIVLPLLKPALVTALIYSFVRSMTTVSAVIFLVTAKYDLATTYIIGRVGNGDYGVALAYCTVLMVLMAAMIIHGVKPEQHCQYQEPRFLNLCPLPGGGWSLVLELNGSASLLLDAHRMSGSRRQRQSGGEGEVGDFLKCGDVGDDSGIDQPLGKGHEVAGVAQG